MSYIKNVLFLFFFLFSFVIFGNNFHQNHKLSREQRIAINIFTEFYENLKQNDFLELENVNVYQYLLKDAKLAFSHNPVISQIKLVYKNLHLNQSNSSITVHLSDTISLDLRKYAHREKPTKKRHKQINTYQQTIKLWIATIIENNSRNSCMFWCEKGYDKIGLFLAKLESLERKNIKQEVALAKAAEGMPLEQEDLGFLLHLEL